MSRAKALFALASSLLLTAAALLLTEERPILGWLAVALFSLCTVAALKLLVSDEFYLRLTREGFELAGLLRHREFRWAEVDPFQVASVHGLRFLSVTPRSPADAQGWAALLRRYGRATTIASLYATPIDEICQTMNAWRERHSDARSDAPSRQT